LSSRPANEQAAGFIAVGGLPLIHVIVVIGTGQVQNTDVSLMLLPLLFAAVAWILCRALDVGKAWGAVYTLGCAGACWMAAVVVGLFDSLFLPW
jgi:hypothetical protein